MTAIQGSYTQKRKKAEIKDLVEKYYRKSLQHPAEGKLWSKLYAEGSLGKKAHSATSKFLTGLTGKCCYCQEKIFHQANVNIDHILPREAYPQFTFWPENLAAACITCNAIKSSSDYFNVSPDELIYRRHRKFWKCFHPNFHDFHEHVDMLAFQTNYFYVRAYVGKTPQGKEICTKLLSKITDYSVKSIANKEVDMAVSGLQSAMSQADSVSMSNVKKLIADLIKHL